MPEAVTRGAFPPLPGAVLDPGKQPALQAPHANSVSLTAARTAAYQCLLLVCGCGVQVVQLCLQLQGCLLRGPRHLLLGVELLQQHTLTVLCALLLVLQLLCLLLHLLLEQQLSVPLRLLLRGLGASAACLQQQHSQYPHTWGQHCRRRKGDPCLQSTTC